jgi:hypothetical protein
MLYFHLQENTFGDLDATAKKYLTIEESSVIYLQPLKSV